MYLLGLKPILLIQVYLKVLSNVKVASSRVIFAMLEIQKSIWNAKITSPNAFRKFIYCLKFKLKKFGFEIFSRNCF